MKAFIGVGLIALMSATTPALANHGGHDAGINERQHQLHQRIEHGRRTGELTPHEYRRLLLESREIDRAEHFFRSDGHLSGRERSELHARLDHLSRAVQRERRDFERLPGSYNHGYPAHRRF